MNEDEVKKAYEAFALTDGDTDCGCDRHWDYEIDMKTLRRTGALIDRDDSRVCIRERLWRRYVRLRDAAKAGKH